MKIITTFFLLLFSFFSSFCQLYDPMDTYTEQRKKIIMIQGIKSQKMFAYACDKEGQIVIKTKKLRNTNLYDKRGNTLKQEMNYGNFKFISEYKYDDRGNLIESINKENEHVSEIQKHFYDENNIKIISKTFDANGTLMSSHLPPTIQGDYRITYDDKGNIQSKSYSNYDSTKRIFVSRLLDKKGNNVYENKFTLNKLGLITEWYITDKVQNIERYTSYTYDDKGNRVEEISKILPQKQTQRIINLYDINNLLIEQKLFGENLRLAEIIKYKYEKH